MTLSKEQKAKNRVRDDELCALIGKPKGWNLHGENTLEALALIRDKLGGRFTWYLAESSRPRRRTSHWLFPHSSLGT